MKQYKVSEQETLDVFNKQVMDMWKDINEESFRPIGVQEFVIVRVPNFTRILVLVDLLYKMDPVPF